MKGIGDIWQPTVGNHHSDSKETTAPLSFNPRVARLSVMAWQRKALPCSFASTTSTQKDSNWEGQAGCTQNIHNYGSTPPVFL